MDKDIEKIMRKLELMVDYEMKKSPHFWGLKGYMRYHNIIIPLKHKKINV